MAIRNYYIGVESLSLTTLQKAQLLDAIKQLGANTDPRPASRNHWRVRLDNNAVIFHALFDEDLLTVAVISQQLATLFSVPVIQVTATTATNIYGQSATFVYLAVNRLLIQVFGGVTATSAESRAQVLAYLAANSAAWEAPT